jgi:hypothetical protein
MRIIDHTSDFIEESKPRTLIKYSKFKTIHTACITTVNNQLTNRKIPANIDIETNKFNLI